MSKAWTPISRACDQPTLAVSYLRRCVIARNSKPFGRDVLIVTCETAFVMATGLLACWPALPERDSICYAALDDSPPLDPDRPVDDCISAYNDGTSSPHLRIVHPV